MLCFLARAVARRRAPSHRSAEVDLGAEERMSSLHPADDRCRVSSRRCDPNYRRTSSSGLRASRITVDTDGEGQNPDQGWTSLASTIISRGARWKDLDLIARRA
jgi:hypothetical protein